MQLSFDQSFSALLIIAQVALVAGAALAVFVVLSAVALRLTAAFLRYPPVRFANALKATAAATVTVFTLKASIWATYFLMSSWVTRQLGRRIPGWESVALVSTPPLWLQAAVFATLISALIYQRVLAVPKADLELEPRYPDDYLMMGFGDAVTLAAVQLAVSITTFLLLGFLLLFQFSSLLSL
ncbi:MAG: hypothetical protein KDA80_07940 [Planctomycetaceae bacterium]|nr:hypothetical protein [Planctomycetaceae bacterium]